ncbi:MAG: hypothetical protein LIO96_05280 [Lachnospiraceae bacterium]|nr:hypothetical protein [Lachnospiraceae bacterium]
MNQVLRVTVLIENTSDSKLACEHGLSLFIEFGEKQILLDAGSSETCAFSEEEINDLCHAFLQEGIDRIYTGHCTGTPGVEKLQSRLGSRVHRLTTGMQFSL